MKLISRLLPRTLESQLVAVLALSLSLLLTVIIALDIVDRDSPIAWAESDATLNRLGRMRTVLKSIPVDRRGNVLKSISQCHDGYTLTPHPYTPIAVDTRTEVLAATIARRLRIDSPNVSVGHAHLTRNDFSYRACTESEIDLPMTAIVVSIRLRPNQWFNTEVHPHEWHFQDLLVRIVRYGAAFILVGAIATLLIRRLSKALNSLTRAATHFADGLKVSEVNESGPQDLKRAIQAFNTMQRQVAGDVKKRTDTLAAISHDLRTPLTALRIRAEFIEDDEARTDFIASIDKMDKIIESAVDFLRGESRSEPLRTIDLSAMLQSECSDFEETGKQAEFVGERGVHYTCRSEALARAVRNLIENANKYGSGAKVDLRTGSHSLDIIVSDTGPGISEDHMVAALEPFRRLSKARESYQGGFGLGLAIVNAIAQGHDGKLILATNNPSGLVATIRLPVSGQ